jgi:hypothetical protein
MRRNRSLLLGREISLDDRKRGGTAKIRLGRHMLINSYLLAIVNITLENKIINDGWQASH